MLFTNFETDLQLSYWVLRSLYAYNKPTQEYLFLLQLTAFTWKYEMSFADITSPASSRKIILFHTQR